MIERVTLWIIICGNPMDGYSYFGPYTSRKEAIDKAEYFDGGNPWWVTELFVMED